MPNQYLLSADFATYGLPNTITNQQVIQASLIIDSYLNKPAGLLYDVDINGNPIYMTGLNPDGTFIATSSITAGNNVVVPVTGPLQTLNGGVTYGQTVVLDRTDNDLKETCVVQSIDMVNRTITLQTVQFNHASGVTLETGLSIMEEKFLPSDRAVTNVSYTPVCNILGIQGQVTYPRRGDAALYPITGMNPLGFFAYFGAFNGTPTFQTLDPTQVEFNSISGQIYLPSSLYSLYFNNVRVYYIAGWTYASLPAAIKQACANIITLNSSTNANNNVAGPITRYKAGGTEIDYANESSDTSNLFFNNESIVSLLAPYRRFSI